MGFRLRVRVSATSAHHQSVQSLLDAFLEAVLSCSQPQRPTLLNLTNGGKVHPLPVCLHSLRYLGVLLVVSLATMSVRYVPIRHVVRSAHVARPQAASSSEPSGAGEISISSILPSYSSYSYPISCLPSHSERQPKTSHSASNIEDLRTPPPQIQTHHHLDSTCLLYTSPSPRDS